jgi:hypothetical protein
MTYTYRMVFPIENDSLRVSQVINQAVLLFPAEAEARGIRIIGDVKAWIDGDQVHCEAAAEVIDGRRPTAFDLHGWKVAALAGTGLNDRQIGDELGVSSAVVQRIRAQIGAAPRRTRARTSATASLGRTADDSESRAS